MNTISIYTDGSCNPGYRIGAWGAIILHGQEKKILHGYERNTTHQRMELAGVINALAHLLENNLTSPSINIYTDSQYIIDLPARKDYLRSVNYITKKNTPLANASLVETLFKLCEKLPVTFTKLKAHQKKGEHEKINREVDMLCRKIMRSLL